MARERVARREVRQAAEARLLHRRRLLLSAIVQVIQMLDPARADLVDSEIFWRKCSEINHQFTGCINFK
jgi:hypothetical protein